MGASDTAHDSFDQRAPAGTQDVRGSQRRRAWSGQGLPRPSDFPRMRPARAALVVILGAALVAGALGIIGHVAQFSRLREGLARASFEWIPIAICGKVAGYAGYITAYKKLAAMRGGPELSTWMATRVLGLNTLQWLSLGVGASVAGVAAMLGLASHVPIGMALGWPVTVAFCFVAGAAASAPGR